jgi:hypothetical protein
MLFILTPESHPESCSSPSYHLPSTTYHISPITSLASCQEQKRRTDKGKSVEAGEIPPCRMGTYPTMPEPGSPRRSGSAVTNLRLNRSESKRRARSYKR